MDYKKISLEKHKEFKWKLYIKSKVELNTKDDLSIYYTPWVAQPCLEIEKNPELAYDMTWKNNTIAIVSDWSAVLWLWNIWWLAWLPVMEWKAILFKEFWNVDAIPIVLKTQDPDEIINVVENISPTFWWINLEDIKAPQCFYIEEELKKKLNIPVFHDDQHWTAIVVLAWLINSLKLVWKKISDIKIVVSWAWSAGIACSKLLIKYWAKNVIIFDSKWTLHKDRENLNKYKQEMVKYNINDEKWTLKDVIKWADLFLWVSQPKLLTAEDIKNMNDKSIVFAMANPDPEVLPEEAKKWWVYIMATGRSDYPNQINNVLAFPGLFRWVLDNRIKNITDDLKIVVAEAIANYIQNPSVDYIIPSPLEKWVIKYIKKAIKDWYDLQNT